MWVIGRLAHRLRVRDKLHAFIQMTQADELMVTASIYDHAARLCSFELVAEFRA